MDHLAQDLGIALEESESCGPINFNQENSGGKWSMRRRTRSAGNLCKPYFIRNRPKIQPNNRFLVLYINNSADNQGDDSSSSNSEVRNDQNPNRLASFHQSDSDEMSLNMVIARAIQNKQSMRMKSALNSYVRGRCTKLGKTFSLFAANFPNFYFIPP